ncbi:hypothetical protein BD770DRAFT_398523 [Pilaira anomala]|nr:hypothetical protein BD770DRAFT_398523 [Pilaira anomala]
MRLLPFEILTVAFSYLETSDLLECQLTSKGWYEASVGYLYSKVVITTSEGSRLYARTLLNSLRLGNYLKSFRTGILFNVSRYKPIWDEHGLIDILVQKCPNLLQILTWSAGSPFWKRISQALTQGQLPKLQELQLCEGKCLESYIQTILLLKKTLVSIWISDGGQYCGMDLDRSNAYRILLQEISEFKKLQYLTLRYYSNKQLSYYDSLMDDIPLLKGLTISHYATVRTKMIVEPGKPINPHPNVRNLNCSWDLINNESQLRYVIQKFPKLQHLVVDHDIFLGGDNTVDSSAVIEFLSHVISLVLEFKIELQLKYEDAIIVWTKLISMNERYKDTILIYHYNEEPFSDDIIFHVEKKTLVIKFPVHKDDVVFPHIKFLSTTGGRIQSLTLNTDDNPISGLEEPTDFYINFDNLNWTIGILKLCPSLQQLTLTNDSANASCFSDDVPLNTNVKKLTVVNVVDENVPLLNDISVIHPTIKHVRIYNNSLDNHNCRESPIIINIKNASLELLSWVSTTYQDDMNEEFKAYIKLTTRKGPKYYTGDINGLLPISAKSYKIASKNYKPSLQSILESSSEESSSEESNFEDLGFRKSCYYNEEDRLLVNICFEITCQSLAEFRIDVKHSKQEKYKWNF